MMIQTLENNRDSLTFYSKIGNLRQVVISVGLLLCSYDHLVTY